MRIERTKDMGIIRNIMINHTIYPHISDDGLPEAEYFQPNESDEIYYLLVIDDNGLIHGLYLLHAMNYITYEIHTCLLRSCRGKMADIAAKEVLKWISLRTLCLKVITHVPENNKPALAYAKRAGMIIEGMNRDSFLKNGKLYNQILLGITRTEICQQQQ